MGSGNSGLYKGTHGANDKKRTLGLDSSKKNAVVVSSIKDNITPSFKRDYGFNNGFFGKESENKSAGKDVRNISSTNPLKTSKNFYNRLTKGGTEKNIPAKSKKGKGEMHVIIMPDGATVTYREISSSDGSPAVDINIKYCSSNSGIKSQKIHFTGEKK